MCRWVDEKSIQSPSLVSWLDFSHHKKVSCILQTEVEFCVVVVESKNSSIVSYWVVSGFRVVEVEVVVVGDGNGVVVTFVVLDFSAEEGLVVLNVWGVDLADIPRWSNVD